MLDQLIHDKRIEEQKRKGEVAAGVAAGAAAQESLKQVQALLVDLTRDQGQRDGILAREHQLFSAATTKANDVSYALGPVRQVLQQLPEALRAALDGIVADKLSAPLDPNRNFQSYALALAKANQDLAKAAVDAENARVTESLAQLKNSLQEKFVLHAAVVPAISAADDATKELARTVTARTANDVALAYWANALAAADVAAATSAEIASSVDGAEKSLTAAFDEYTRAKQERIQAEGTFSQAQAAQGAAVNDLKEAGRQVLKRLSDRVNQPTPPPQG
jgi:hypothetical protein